MSHPYLLSVCAGREQLPGILRAKAMGFKVIGLDASESAFAKEAVDLFICEDILNTGMCLKKIGDLGIKVSAVVSFVSEVGNLAASRIRESLALPGNTSDQVLALSDKCVMRRIMSDAGLNTPAWASHTRIEDALSWLQNFRGPAILKPADASGSRGVFKALSGHWERQITEAMAYSRSGSVITEEFLEGTEYSVESMVIEGKHHWLTTSQRVRLHDTTATEIFTTHLPTEIHLAMLSQIEGFIRAIGLRNSPLHTEILVTREGKPVIIEIAGRGGGFMVSEGIVPAVTGYSISAAVIEIAAGKSPSPPAPTGPNRFVSLRFLLGKAGILNSIKGSETAGAILARFPGSKMELFPKQGDLIADPVNDGSRVGYVMLVGNSLPAAREASELISRTLEFVIGEKL